MREPIDYLSPIAKFFKKNGKKKRNIHIYVDTSRPKKPESYLPVVKSIINAGINKRITVHATTFSHEIGNTLQLNYKGWNTKRAFEHFQTLQPSYGGTDFRNIWNHINKEFKRRERLNIIVTDFAYLPPEHYENHPQNLYYAPIVVKNENEQKCINENIKWFCNKMKDIEPDIENRIWM